MRVDIAVDSKRSNWLKEHGIGPVVEIDERLGRVRIPGISSIATAPAPNGGVHCYRMYPYVYLGLVSRYGVRDTPTADFHNLLSLIRVALFPGTTYPAPICYELKDGRVVHPGECFAQLRRVIVKTTRYHLNDDQARACCVCKSRLQ